MRVEAVRMSGVTFFSPPQFTLSFNGNSVSFPTSVWSVLLRQQYDMCHMCLVSQSTSGQCLSVAAMGHVSRLSVHFGQEYLSVSAVCHVSRFSATSVQSVFLWQPAVSQVLHFITRLERTLCLLLLSPFLVLVQNDQNISDQ